MNWGDVGRIEHLFVPLIALFKSTGKHKYSSAMIQFMGSMLHVYPERLRHAIRLNWLVNPSGKPDGFRSVDWLVELNNLYTKVIYGGKFSNRTLNLMIKQSALIDVFRGVHTIIEDWLHLQQRTTRHTPRDMRKTIARLAAYMAARNAHVFTEGRQGVMYSVPDQIRVGVFLLATGK